MKSIIRRILSSITASSKGTVITAGGLIIGALAAGRLLQNEFLWAVLMGLSAVVSGLPIGVKALRSLVNRHIGIELLVSLATVGALFIQEYWEAAAVTFLFNIGGYLEARTMARTRRVIGELIEIAPSTAILLKSGEQVSVPIEEIRIGDMLLVKPGSRIPVDGAVESGSSRVNESAISGEPLPVLKQPGDSLFAGTQNENGVLTLIATGVGEDTTLARIIHRVEEAQEARAPAQRFMERFARWYTPPDHRPCSCNLPLYKRPVLRPDSTCNRMSGSPGNIDPGLDCCRYRRSGAAGYPHEGRYPSGNKR